MKNRLLLLSMLSGVLVVAAAQWNPPSTSIPAFHSAPPAKAAALPPILTEKQLADEGFIDPAVVAGYKAAAKASSVFYQMPCYCYCDRSHGHQSLRSCFESTHGANCGTCIQEAVYVYQMTKKGWTATQIRAGIERGDYKKIDLQHPQPVN